MDFGDIYELAKNGDRAAEKRLYEQLLVSFRIIVRHRIWDRQDGEDLVQDALMSVFSKFDQINIHSSFAAWAHKVLSNKILDYVKLKQLRGRKMEEFFEEQAPMVAPTSDSSLKARIIRCLAKINKSHKQHVLILSLRTQGYSTEDICQRLNITRNNCWVSLSRARSMLETCLKQEEAVS